MTKPLPDHFPEPQIERISMRRISAFILSSLNLERGLLFTLWALLRNPGEAMREYLFVDRSRYFEPLKLLILSLAIYLFLLVNIMPEDGFMSGFEEGFLKDNPSAKKEAFFQQITDFIQQHANLILLISIPVSAIVSCLCFWRHRLWYTEHLVLNAYLYGFMSVLGSILMLFLVRSTISITIIIQILSLVYLVYFFKSFFRISWLRSIATSFLIFLGSQFLFILTLLIIMVGYAFVTG